MKKILIIAGILIALPSLLLADSESKKWGIGVNYPGLGVKYRLNTKQTLELNAQFGKDVFVVGPRYCHNFSSKGKTTLFFGVEVDHVSFKGDPSEGSGFVIGAFVGGEYFTTPNFGVSLDMGPAYVSLKDKGTSQDEGGIDFITNLGLTYYKPSHKLSPPKRIKKQEKPPAQTIPPPKPEPKTEPETTSPSPLKTTFEEANLIVKMDTSLYSGPSAVYSVITKLDCGTKLLLLDESNPAYYKVKLSDGTVGWVASFHVKGDK